MEKLEIGSANIKFNTIGVATDASFTPVMKIEGDPKLLASLAAIGGKISEETIKARTNLLLGAYFNKANEIELADRDHYEIHSEITSCDKYPTGILQEITVKYFFQELEAK